MSTPPLKNFHAQLVDTLGSQIVDGTLPAGDRLPTEDRLAAQFGASRLVIREAMKSLAAKGLVTIRPRTGTHVQPRSAWNLFDPDVLGWHAGAPLQAQFIADLMELRQAIEPLAAGLAAGRADARAVAALREAMDAMTAAGSQADYIEADLRLHATVMQACGNAFIQHLAGALSEVLKTSFTASSDAWGPDARALALHEALVRAIETGDAPAAQTAANALIARATERIETGLARRAARRGA